MKADFKLCAIYCGFCRARLWHASRKIGRSRMRPLLRHPVISWIWARSLAEVETEASLIERSGYRLKAIDGR